jgi:hypothetical protein
MKKIISVCKKSLSLLALLTIFFNRAKSQVIVEAEGGVGYTFMDMEKWSETEPQDWSQFEKHFSVNALYRKSNFALGASYGINYLCWSYVRIRYGTQVISRTYEGNAQKFALLLRYYSSNFFFDFHGGAYMFDGYTNLGVGTSAGLRIRLNDQLSIPLKLDVTTIFIRDQEIVPVSFSTGLSYQFKSSN